MTTMPAKQTHRRRFAIAVSFPGEHRRFVLNIVKRLAEHLGRDRVFYDEWYESELVGLDGDLKLRRYYHKESQVVVPFFSEHYKKEWCQIEWSAIRAMLKVRREEDAVIPVQIDGTSIEGWEAIDFPIRKGKRSGKEIADLIVEAYRKRYPKNPSKAASPRRAPKSASEERIESRELRRKASAANLETVLRSNDSFVYLSVPGPIVTTLFPDKSLKEKLKIQKKVVMLLRRLSHLQAKWENRHKYDALSQKDWEHSLASFKKTEWDGWIRKDRQLVAVEAHVIATDDFQDRKFGEFYKNAVKNWER